MGNRINWDIISEFEEMIKGQGLKLAEGSRKFGVPPWQLYVLSRSKKNGGGSKGSKESSVDEQLINRRKNRGSSLKKADWSRPFVVGCNYAESIIMRN